MSVFALALVAAAGVTAASVAYTWARAGAVEQAATTVRIDGVPHDCGPHRAVWVTVASDGPAPARFAVDGVEVPSQRLLVAGTDRVETDALLPESARSPRCDTGAAHRYEVLTIAPQGCRWTVSSQQTQEEARGHQWALQESGTSCVLLLE